MSIYKTRQELIDKAKEFGMSMNPYKYQTGNGYNIGYEIIQYINQPNAFVIREYGFDLENNVVSILPPSWIGNKIKKNINEVFYVEDDCVIFKSENQEEIKQLNRLSNRCLYVYRLKDYLICHNFFIDVSSKEDLIESDK